MTKGSCLCGNITYEFEGDPVAKAACHCRPCQKTSGCSNSLNLMVPRDKLKITKGTPKKFTRKGDSGKDVIYHFCSECPSIILVEITAMPEIWVVKYGSVDDLDVLHKAKPEVEIYTKHRFAWQEAMPGLPQKEAS